MELGPYLNFGGNCREAFEFYAKCLGGKIEMIQTHGESPMKDQTPPDWQDKIIHVRMTVGPWVLMGSDAPPQYFERPQGFTVSIGVDKVEDAERIFNELSEKGVVKMPLQETFWAKRFGMVDDRFGTPWMVNCG